MIHRSRAVIYLTIILSEKWCDLVFTSKRRSEFMQRNFCL